MQQPIASGNDILPPPSLGEGSSKILNHDLAHNLYAGINDNKARILWTLSHLTYIFSSTLDLVDIYSWTTKKRTLEDLQKQGLIIALPTSYQSEELAAYKSTLSRVDLNNTIFYTLADDYYDLIKDPHFQSLIERKYLKNQRSNYHIKIHTLKDKINRIRQTLEHNTPEEKAYLKQTKELLQSDSHYLEGRHKAFNKRFSKRITLKQFEHKLEQIPIQIKQSPQEKPKVDLYEKAQKFFEDNKNLKVEQYHEEAKKLSLTQRSHTIRLKREYDQNGRI